MNTSALASIASSSALSSGLVRSSTTRFLAAVEPDEIGALALRQRVIAAREIALRPLDLDDARAGVGEAARAHRRGDGLFERDDENAFQWQRHA